MPNTCESEWIPKLMILFAALFITVMTCYAIWPLGLMLADTDMNRDGDELPRGQR